MEVTTQTNTEDPSVLATETSADESIALRDGDKDKKGGRKAGAYVPMNERVNSPVARAVRDGENRTLRELIESFGAEGAYQISVTRKEPDEVIDRATGKATTTAGFLKTFENKPIDEDYILQHYGGGTYELKFKERKATGSGWQYAGQKIVKIAGDPLLTALPGAHVATSAPAAPATESPSLVTKALEMANDAAKRAEDRAAAALQARPNDSAMIDLMRDQIRAAETRNAELLAEIRAMRNAPPPPQSSEEKVKDKLLDKLMDNDSARLQATRMQYESEIRSLKENALANEQRLRDQFERDRQELRNIHERELALVRQSTDTQVALAKSSYDTQLSAHKSSFDTQLTILREDNRRLNDEVGRLRDELKELRSKKELSITDMADQLKKVKDALDDGDDSDSSIGGKLLEAATSPEVWQGVAGLVRGPQAPAEPKQEAAPEPKRRVFRHTDGKKYILEADGKTVVGPLPEKKKRGQVADGEGENATDQVPQIDPAAMAKVVAFLESAFTGGQDPEVVAQGARSLVPEDLLVAIRDLGVDQVMSKMAKLSSTSPLSSQAGKNWLRKLGKALVGE